MGLFVFFGINIQIYVKQFYFPWYFHIFKASKDKFKTNLSVSLPLSDIRFKSNYKPQIYYLPKLGVPQRSIVATPWFSKQDNVV